MPALPAAAAAAAASLRGEYWYGGASVWFGMRGEHSLSRVNPQQPQPKVL